MNTVKYPNFYNAIQRCLEEIKISGENHQFFSTKSDLKSALCFLPLAVSEFMLLTMKGVSPLDGKTNYFVDKCLPFRALISCALFQDCLAHIQKVKYGKVPVNYLDDFYFVAFLRQLCNRQVDSFIDMSMVPQKCVKFHYSDAKYGDFQLQAFIKRNPLHI